MLIGVYKLSIRIDCEGQGSSFLGMAQSIGRSLRLQAENEWSPSPISFDPWKRNWKCETPGGGPLLEPPLAPSFFHVDHPEGV